MFIHDWNGKSITQLTSDTKISKFDIPAGYVNVTTMCGACGKLWADYARLESTKAFWEGLSTDMGIPIPELVISIKGGNDKQAQGTWAYSEIAIDCAQWVSVEFRIWANRALRQIISKIEAPEEVGIKQNLQIPIPTPEEISTVLDLTLGKTNLDVNLIAGVKLNAIAKQHPQYALVAETAKSVLSVVVEDELLSPTQLAELLNKRTNETWSAQKVNKLLIEQDFQFSNPEGKNPDYLPTDKGKEYSKLILNTAKNRDKTIQSLRWFKEVLDVLGRSNSSQITGVQE